jgi:hypothetical protein
MDWSYSRRSDFEQCLRSYYYRHYGAARGAKRGPETSQLSLLEQIPETPVPGPSPERLRFLKGLSNRHLRSGEIVHLVIRGHLKALQNGDRWSVDRTLGWARQMFRRDLAYSRSFRPEAEAPAVPFPPALLLEFYYGLPDAESVCAVAEDRLLAALEGFVTAQEFEMFRIAASNIEANIERPFHVRDNGISLRGKLDLCARLDGRVAIIDWKTGESNGGNDSLQLLSYALGAMNAFNCGPEELDLYLAHLGDRQVVRFPITGSAVSRAKARIAQDLERMQVLDEYGRSGVAEAFTPCGQSRVCALCPFQEFCPKG